MKKSADNTFFHSSNYIEEKSYCQLKMKNKMENKREKRFFSLYVEFYG